MCACVWEKEKKKIRGLLTEPLSPVWAVPHGGSGDDTRSLGGLGGGKFWESSDGKSHGYLLVGSKL